MKEHSMMSGSVSGDLATAIRRAQLSLLASAYFRWVRKYRLDQPRAPGGSREGGQWTAEGETGEAGSGGGSVGGSGTFNVEEGTGSVEVSIDKANEGLSAEAFDIEFIGSRTTVTIDYSRALTGMSTIDDVTAKLSETLGDTMSRVDMVPEWAPSVYGTAVHVDFAAQVRLQGLRGVEVEQSFFEKEPGGTGSPGSIRTDVLLRNDTGEITAIYDVKTGNAVLTTSRVREFREKLVRE